MALKHMPDEERFWSKVDKNGPVPSEAPELGRCWLWTASNIRGYGQFQIGSRTGNTRKMVKAHRFAYEHVVGAIPDGLQIDHLCNNPTCVNPSHLRTVTARVNVLRNSSPLAVNTRAARLRTDTCLHGHTLVLTASGKLKCPICAAAGTLRYRQRHPDRVKEYEQSHKQQAAARQAAYRARKKANAD